MDWKEIKRVRFMVAGTANDPRQGTLRYRRQKKEAIWVLCFYLGTRVYEAFFLSRLFGAREYRRTGCVAFFVSLIALALLLS